MNSILFNRELGSVGAVTVDSSIFDHISYAAIKDESIDVAINAQVERFHALVEKAKANSGSGVVTAFIIVGMYERSVHKTWWSEKENKAYWEKWIIPLHVRGLSTTNTVTPDDMTKNNNNYNNNNNNNIAQLSVQNRII